MNAIEALEIIKLRNTAYPRTSSIQNMDSLEKEAKLFSNIFNEDFIEVELALNECINKLAFPPTISDIKNEIAWSKELKPLEALAEVERVMRLYGTPRTIEALASLNGNVLKAVKQIGFRELCLMPEMKAKETFIQVYKEVVLNNQRGRVC